jgi:hypothetical protein
LNKNKNIQTLLFILLTTFAACGQTNIAQTNTESTVVKSDSSFAFSNFIAGKFAYFNVDKLGNMYVINAANQLKKINSKGDSLGIFNDVKRFGIPNFVDVNNPLKILLYYDNYATVVVLDRFLAIRNTINFRKGNIFKVHALATSYDNNIWIFDEQDFKLKKINDAGVPLSESSDWRQIFDEAPTPTDIIDSENLVYAYDPQKGFYIFDYYGSLKTTLPFTNWEHVVVANGTMFGFVNNTLQRYQLNTLDLKTYKLPTFFSNYSNIIALNNKVYLLKSNGIEIYNIL